MTEALLSLAGVEERFWQIAFLMTRIGAALLAAPLFGAAGVPVVVRTAAAGALACFVAFWVPVESAALTFSLAGLVDVAGEVVLGLALGFVLQIAFAAPVVAAELIGGGMGMSMAMAASPDGQGARPVFGNFLTIMLTLIFLGVGGHLVWLRLVVESYAAFPPGDTWLGAEQFAAIAEFGGVAFAAGLAIALPIAVILLVVQIVTGVVSRSAPALNVFALGLPLGVLAGIAGLIVCLPLIFANLSDLSAQALARAAGLLGG